MTREIVDLLEELARRRDDNNQSDDDIRRVIAELSQPQPACPGACHHCGCPSPHHAGHRCTPTGPGEEWEPTEGWELVHQVFGSSAQIMLLGIPCRIEPDDCVIVYRRKRGEGGGQG